MRKQAPGALALLGCVLLLTWPAPAAAQKEKVYHTVTPTQLEAVLADLAIKYQKSQPKGLPDDYDYDFDRNGFKYRLQLQRGKVVWIMVFFPKATLEKVNDWNVNAKFSRAVLDRVGDRDYAIIESQLNADNGLTDNRLRQFFKRFDGEVTSFDTFLKK
jgi:hypothetical protein